MSYNMFGLRRWRPEIIIWDDMSDNPNRKGKDMNEEKYLTISTHKADDGSYVGYGISSGSGTAYVSEYGKSHSDAALKVAERLHFTGLLSGMITKDNHGVWSHDIPGTQHIDMTEPPKPAPAPEPLLKWEDGPVCVASCGSNVYRIFRKPEGCEIYINSKRQGGWYNNEKDARTHVNSWVHNLTWTPGPVCVARVGDVRIEIKKGAALNYVWTCGKSNNGFASIDECKADAERWAQEQAAKNRPTAMGLKQERLRSEAEQAKAYAELKAAMLLWLDTSSIMPKCTIPKERCPFPTTCKRGDLKKESDV